MQIRQGDVCVDFQCYGIGPCASAAQRIVVAEGEKTGHAHVLETEDEKYPLHFKRLDDVLYVSIPSAGATLKHEEHGTAVLPGGDYAFRIQKEFDEQQGSRGVLD